MRARMIRLVLHAGALGIEALGTVFIFLDVVRLNARFPPRALGTIGDPLQYRVWYYHASVPRLALLFLGIFITAIVLWLEYKSLPHPVAHSTVKRRIRFE